MNLNFHLNNPLQPQWNSAIHESPLLTAERLVDRCRLQVVGTVQVHVDVLQADEPQVGGEHGLTGAGQVLLVVVTPEGEKLAALLAQRLDEDLVGAGVGAAQQPGGRCGPGTLVRDAQQRQCGAQTDP